MLSYKPVLVRDKYYHYSGILQVKSRFYTYDFLTVDFKDTDTIPVKIKHRDTSCAEEVQNLTLLKESTNLSNVNVN